MEHRLRLRKAAQRVAGIPLVVSLCATTLAMAPAVVLTAGPAAAATTPTAQQATVDNVQLTVTTKDFPATTFTSSQPGDLLQGADATVDSPSFARFSIVGVPFGYDDTDEDPALGSAATGQAATWQQTLADDWASQGAATATGPVANLFGQQVTGTLIQPTIPADGITPRQVDMVQWVVEAGGRLWVVKDMQDHTADTATFADDLVVSSPNVDVATSVGNGTATGAVVSPNQTYAVAEAMSMAVSAGGTTSGEASSLPALPTPGWWKGSGLCDSGNSTGKLSNFALHYSSGGNTVVPSFRGMTACGPTRHDRKAVGDGEPTVSIGGFGEYEWECVELSQRYLYLAGYTSGAYGAMGNTVVDHYPGTKMVKVHNNAVAGVVPVAGDVVSMNHSNVAGHTAVVIGSNVDSSGNGTISVLQNNWDDTGVGTMPVKAWKVYGENYWGGTDVDWLHDPNNTGASGPPPTAPGVGLAGVSDGQTVTGTVILQATPNMAVAGMYYHVVNQGNGHDTVSPAVYGGAPYSYALNTLNLPNGNYRVYAAAPLSGHPTGESRQISFTINNNLVPPAPQLTAPSGIQSGVVTMSATSSGATSIAFLVDGAEVGTAQPGAAFAWDTATAADGTHVITAVAANTAGRSGASAAASFIVSNDRSAVARIQTTAGAYMALFRGSDGHLWSISDSSTGWRNFDWTNAGAGAPSMTGSPIGWQNSSGFYMGVFRGADGHIWSVGDSATGWSSFDWTNAAPNSPLAAANGSPYAFQQSDGSYIALYQGADGHLWSVGSSAGGWRNFDWTNAAPNTPNMTGSPIAWQNSNGTYMAVFRAVNGHIWSISDDTTGKWSSFDWTNAAPNSPLATGSPYAFQQPDGNYMALFRGADGHLWSVGSSAGGWRNFDWTNAGAGAPSMTGSPIGWQNSSGFYMGVFRGADGHIWSVGDSATGWSSFDWTNAAPNSPLAAGSPYAYQQSDGNYIALYQGTDGHLWSVGSGSSGWRNFDWTNAAPGSPAMP